MDFLKEAFRILKPGGKIAVIDGFLNDKKLGKEKGKYKKILEGWILPNLSSKEKFQKDLKKTGFKNIKFYDKNESIQKSSKRMYRMGCYAYLATKIAYGLKIISKKMHGNLISALNQRKLFRKKYLIYGVFVAEK